MSPGMGLKRLWLQLRGVRIGSGSWVAPGARIDRQGGAISIGDRTTIHEGARLLAAGGAINIGCDCSVNPGCVLYGHGGLEIGNGVRIAVSSVFVPANHCFDDPPDRFVSGVKLGKESGAVTMSGSGRMSLCWMAWS